MGFLEWLGEGDVLITMVGIILTITFSFMSIEFGMRGDYYAALIFSWTGLSFALFAVNHTNRFEREHDERMNS